MTNELSPAELASQEALHSMYNCLGSGNSFRLEAGAGAGKTYSLIKALNYLISQNQRNWRSLNKRVACITFTNVARDEIVSRIDRHPLVLCETNHSFCWSLIANFQKQLRELIPTLNGWPDKIEEFGEVTSQKIEYSQGYRSISESSISLHHDDILPLTIELMENEKFRSLIADQFPVILIDEYQDTEKSWAASLANHFLGKPSSPLLGFFGDHWQKIYPEGCGKIEHEALIEIGKEANFRSVQCIVDCLNRMRPDLPQFVEDPQEQGEVIVFHTNKWPVERRPSGPGGHWEGDLPEDAARKAFTRTKASLADRGWDLSAKKTKILMLTHKGLAAEQGYSSIPTIFSYPDSFKKKESKVIAYLVDILEPACSAYEDKQFGRMFDALGDKVPLINKHEEKLLWKESLDALVSLRQTGTVGDILDHLSNTQKPRLPETIEWLEKSRQEWDEESEEKPSRSLSELNNLRKVKYSEIKALQEYLDGHSPFETKHGVKGAQFENVLVIIGRGWNHYNFGEMLELASRDFIPANKINKFERNRNLFYVSCSRPEKRLALLFTQKLSSAALDTLEEWFLPSSIQDLDS